MTLERLTEIVRTRYTTGAYGDCHLSVARDVLAAFPAAVERAARHNPPPIRPVGGALADLLSIPVVVDDGAESGTWALVHTTGPLRDVVQEAGQLAAPDSTKPPRLR